MKKRLPPRQFHGKSSRTVRDVRTGEHCPVNGWWVPASRKAEAHFVAEGSIMPPHQGKSMAWTMVASQFGSRKPKYTHPAAGDSFDTF